MNTFRFGNSDLAKAIRLDKIDQRLPTSDRHPCAAKAGTGEGCQSSERVISESSARRAALRVGARWGPRSCIIL
eukprot:5169808-Lingulodinium_polyedra.AAC.1